MAFEDFWLSQTSTPVVPGASLRFGTAGKNLSRSFGVSGDLQLWTWSAWIKLDQLILQGGGLYTIFSYFDGCQQHRINFNGNPSVGSLYAGCFQYTCGGGGVTQSYACTLGSPVDAAAWFH